MILIDSNIIIDIVTRDANWFVWSQGALARSAADGKLGINHVILAELNSRPDIAAGLSALREKLAIEICSFSEAAAVRAGQAFGRYRRAGGPRTAILGDFLIGGHAAVGGWPLITRDRRRFAGYFPELVLVAPEDIE